MQFYPQIESSYEERGPRRCLFTVTEPPSPLWCRGGSPASAEPRRRGFTLHPKLSPLTGDRGERREGTARAACRQPPARRPGPEDAARNPVSAPERARRLPGGKVAFPVGEKERSGQTLLRARG